METSRSSKKWWLAFAAVAVAVNFLATGGAQAIDGDGGRDEAERDEGERADVESDAVGTELLAFPEAEGFGRFARGGRGGQVVIVDTLEDVVSENDGRTSLREAIEVMNGPRTVVFDVGGTFDTGENTLFISGEEHSYVTVACQSAPAPGVLIRGNGIRIHAGAHDVVMRHCAVRNIGPRGEAAESNRAIGVIGTSGDTNGTMIFDHMSLGWATDENFTVFIGPTATADLRDVTLSRSIVAEGDADSDHPESGQLPDRYLHAMGPSCNSSSPNYRVLGCSIIGNLMAHNARRNPLMWGVSGEVLDNVVYNWHETALSANSRQSGRVDLQVRGNLFKSGPTWKTGNGPLMLDDEGTPASNYRVSDNRFMDGTSGKVRVLEEVSVGEPDAASGPVAPFRLECVGASRPERDAFDARVIAEYVAGVGQVGIGQDHQRRYESRPPVHRAADFDADRDGMADVWERARGLNPDDPDDQRGDDDDDGYTNIEEYLAELADC